MPLPEGPRRVCSIMFLSGLKMRKEVKSFMADHEIPGPFSPIRTLTVGPGVSPGLLTPSSRKGARGLICRKGRNTAGGEFRPALRTSERSVTAGSGRVNLSSKRNRRYSAQARITAFKTRRSRAYIGLGNEAGAPVIGARFIPASRPVERIPSHRDRCGAGFSWLLCRPCRP